MALQLIDTACRCCLPFGFFVVDDQCIWIIWKFWCGGRKGRSPCPWEAHSTQLNQLRSQAEGIHSNQMAGMIQELENQHGAVMRRTQNLFQERLNSMIQELQSRHIQEIKEIRNSHDIKMEDVLRGYIEMSHQFEELKNRYKWPFPPTCPRPTCEGSNDMFDAQRSFIFYFPGNLGQRGSMCKVQEMPVFPAFIRFGTHRVTEAWIGHDPQRHISDELAFGIFAWGIWSQPTLQSHQKRVYRIFSGATWHKNGIC